MARKLRRSTFETATARAKLALRKKPYTVARLAVGLILLYRRNRESGVWIVKSASGDGAGYWTDVFATADDIAPADGGKS
jgi:hypothetical protein